MAKKGSVVVRILSQFDDKGVKKATKDLDKASKDFQDFGSKITKSFAIATAAATALAVKIGVDAVRAAMQDQKSAALLAATLHNVVGANDAVVASVEDFVLKTSLATGIVDDQLRPSLAKLLTVTSNVAQAQDLLSLSIDASAGSNNDLDATTSALSKALNGNFGQLQRLFPALDKNIVKTKDFQGALKFLSDTYGGAASVKAATFAGQMDRIKVAIGETTESIGYGMLPALTAIADKITKDVIPAIQKWLTENADKIAAGFATAVGYVVAFAQSVYDVFSFVARNIKVFAELGAVIVAAIAGAKIAAATQALIGVITSLIKVYRALRTATLGAAAAEALLTGGLSAAAGAAAFAAALIGINVAMNKFESDAKKASDAADGLTFNFNGLKVKAADYLKGLTGLDAKNKNTTASTKALTAEQIKALAALKALGVVPKSETDAIELEAARLNLVKQNNLEQQARIAGMMQAYELQMQTNVAAQRYADILQVLADNQISYQEVSILASKWGLTTNQVQEYIARIFAANATPANNDSILALYMAWGLTKEQAQKYLDFAVALGDQKLSDAEIEKLRAKWGMTRDEVLAYAKKVQDGTVFSSTWADPGNAAKKSWEDALAALNAYIKAVTKGTEPVLTGNQGTTNVSTGGGYQNVTSTGLGSVARGEYSDTVTEIITAVADTMIAASQSTMGGVGRGEYSVSGIASFGQSSVNNAASNATGNAGNTTIIIQGNAITQADNVAAMRDQLLGGYLSGKPMSFAVTAI